MRPGTEKGQKKLGQKECVLFAMETEKHFILECEAFKENRDRYTNVLADKSWDDLFNKGVWKNWGRSSSS